MVTCLRDDGVDLIEGLPAALLPLFAVQALVSGLDQDYCRITLYERGFLSFLSASSLPSLLL